MEESLGIWLKQTLKDRKLSMRKFSEQTGVDVATISKIVSGKRKANLQHLQTFSKTLNLPLKELLVRAGIEEEEKDDLLNIEQFVGGEHLSKKEVERKLSSYEKLSETDKGRRTVLENFVHKLKEVGSMGPPLTTLETMYERFKEKQGSKKELALMGSALLYFIFTVDVVPDYVFPLGYVDDAVAIQTVIHMLSVKQ
ncbi:helix-turn-helix domain-containing protein [Halobacillus karajensis]|uniref:HTH cro/C1-type domain-containing protein n=1 Tax=Halobacillus karajensis TaxID=195088 RepID=A0A024P8C3_9BACI|nr:helix-turn-helix domain-containing protein [Halobacillus karajensis]CDQ20955.1 hypothetical protein BN982_03315 [Halobacillus karajensis]CDQ24981.1 hypothetical protein BN983_03282 [Halobacillus karajensis]CDQ28658.1 hypothetical protein BN981_02970 [Halobacillus karajensis]